MSGRPGHPTPGVGAGTAQVEISNGCPVLGGFGVRPHTENLVEIVATVENIA
ncbi:unnamed protein product, partial [marine sediment metagenome]